MPTKITISLEFNGVQIGALIEDARKLEELAPEIDETAALLSQAFELQGVKDCILALTGLRGEDADLITEFNQVEIKGTQFGFTYYIKNEVFSKWGLRLPDNLVLPYLSAAALPPQKAAGVINHKPVSVVIQSIKGKYSVKKLPMPEIAVTTD